MREIFGAISKSHQPDDQEFLKSAAFASYQYVDVVFGPADTDLDIRHSLSPPTPEDIDYLIVRADRGVRVYHNYTGTRRRWGQGYVVLRATAVNAQVTLLLTTRRIL